MAVISQLIWFSIVTSETALDIFPKKKKMKFSFSQKLGHLCSDTFMGRLKKFSKFIFNARLMYLKGQSHLFELQNEPSLYQNILTKRM